MSILWCITGAGHNLSECVEKIEKLSRDNEVTVAFSKAGFEVAVMYGLFNRIEKAASEIILEENQGASAPFVGSLSKKQFEKIVVAPCTANTTAKIVHGIADTLVTNIVAQAGKAKIPVFILPTDAVKVQKTRLPIWVEQENCKKCSLGRKCSAIAKCKTKALYFKDRVRLDLMKCVGCRKCVSACPEGAVTFGKIISIECRDIDLENSNMLSKIEGITVITKLEEI